MQHIHIGPLSDFTGNPQDTSLATGSLPSVYDFVPKVKTEAQIEYERKLKLVEDYANSLDIDLNLF